MRYFRFPRPALALALLVATSSGCGDGRSAADSPPAAEVAVPAGPSAGDVEYADLTASWSDEAFEGCGRTLREALGTRDLVQGALAGIEDPAGRVAAELEDARHWMEIGDAHIAAIRPALAAGTCNPDVTVALDEAVQAYVKTGTAAMQAKVIAES